MCFDWLMDHMPVKPLVTHSSSSYEAADLAMDKGTDVAAKQLHSINYNLRRLKTSASAELCELHAVVDTISEFPR
jgi:hypothetical protein